MIDVSQLGSNYERLPDILDQYERDIADAPARLTLRGKSLAESNKEQSTWPVYYDQRRAEMQSLSKYFLMQVDKVRGQLHQRFTEHHSRALTERDKAKYIDMHEEYLTINELYLAVDELHEKYKAVVEAFRSRGYALRNLVDIAIHQLSDSLM